MSRLVKIVNNKYVQIEEYKNPNICFNTNEYSDFEDYCTLRETFDPFEIFYENQELKSQLRGTTHCFDEDEHRKLKDEIKELEKIIELCHLDAKETLETISYEQESQQKEFIKYLEDEIKRINPKELDIGELNLRLNDIKFTQYLIYKEILQKYKETIQTKIDKSV